MSQANEDRVLIDAAISHCLREQAVPLQIHGFRSLADRSAMTGWLALHAYPRHGRNRLDRRAFFHRARATFNAHRLEWIATEQCLNWLSEHEGWSRAMISISQVSLLVPGLLERLQRRLQRLDFPADQLLVYVVSHEDCDYPEHLADCSQMLANAGVGVVTNRFMPEPADDARLKVDYLRISEPLARALGASLSHQVAVEQMAQRARAIGAELIAPALPTAQCREQARSLGVSIERLGANALGQSLPAAFRRQGLSRKSRRLSG